MARYYEEQWPAYVPVAERRRNAERAAQKLSKKGAALSPVTVEGRKITTTFWGKAWCDNLESYRDYENRLGRGRSYVRNGLVIDLQIAPHAVTAMVSGSSVYTVKITINEVPKPQWKSICADCSGGIDSLVELLRGRFSKPVMERICRQGTGLFPKPADIRFSCSCPDYATMCKHVAAALYGIGARLDVNPQLLFRLRGVDENDLVADVATVLPMTSKPPVTGKVLQDDDMAALFGLDMGDAPEPEETLPPPRAKRAPAPTPKAKQPASKMVTRKAPAQTRKAPATNHKTPAPTRKAAATKSIAPLAQTQPKSPARSTKTTSRQTKQKQAPTSKATQATSAGRNAARR